MQEQEQEQENEPQSFHKEMRDWEKAGDEVVEQNYEITEVNIVLADGSKKTFPSLEAAIEFQQQQREQRDKVN